MRLFEGGILDKITNDEYEKMFQQQTATAQVSDENQPGNVDDERKATAADNNENREITASKEVDGNARKKESSEKELTALSLQMLQGAFYLLILGYILAFLAFIYEVVDHRLRRSFNLKCRAAISHLTKRFQQVKIRINRYL